MDRAAHPPGPGQVLLEVKAASLNFPDLLIVQNKYQIKPPCPLCRARNTPAWCRPWAKGSNIRQASMWPVFRHGRVRHAYAGTAAMCMPLPADFPLSMPPPSS
jgi:NADPH2:quinone reductase